jgi:hypothetical protein
MSFTAKSTVKQVANSNESYHGSSNASNNSGSPFLRATDSIYIKSVSNGATTSSQPIQVRTSFLHHNPYVKCGSEPPVEQNVINSYLYSSLSPPTIDHHHVSSSLNDTNPYQYNNSSSFSHFGERSNNINVSRVLKLFQMFRNVHGLNFVSFLCLRKE